MELVCQRLSKYSGDRQNSELPSHLMEVVYIEDEQYVQQHLPLGYRVLVRISEQVATHHKAGLDKDWFASHSLPTPPQQ